LLCYGDVIPMDKHTQRCARLQMPISKVACVAEAVATEDGGGWPRRDLAIAMENLQMEYGGNECLHGGSVLECA